MGGQPITHWSEQATEEKIDHRSYADQNNGLQATVHEGTSVTQLRRQGIDTEISRYNDHVKQHNAQHLKQQQQRTDSVLQHGLNRAEQNFEQWQKNQEAKRLEQERQAEIQRQQKLEQQQAERANRKSITRLRSGRNVPMSNQNDLDDQLYILLASMKEYRSHSRR